MSREFTERDAIRQLQTYLRAQTLINASAPIIAVDGIFDNATKNALIDFQLRNGLPPTGIADAKSWDLLYSQYLDILKLSSLPNPIIPFPSYPDGYAIERGERSFLVATVQYMLNEIATVFHTFEPIEINGSFDVESELLVKEFQRRNGLLESGKVDRETWDRIAQAYNLSLHYLEQY